MKVGVETGKGRDAEPEEDAAGSRPHRERILEAALRLLTERGRDAVTTRAVAEAAGVQPPVLYRLFEDKRGLLEAVAAHGFALYLAEKQAPQPMGDPIAFLRGGWERHVHFGLAHPELYRLMYADPPPVAVATATGERAVRPAYPGLRRHMQGIAAAGWLQMPADRAADLFHAAACGVVMTLLAQPEEGRDLALSQVACEAALRSMLKKGPPAVTSTVATTANALRAQLMSAEGTMPIAHGGLSVAERALLLEWLARLADPV